MTKKKKREGMPPQLKKILQSDASTLEVLTQLDALIITLNPEKDAKLIETADRIRNSLAKQLQEGTGGPPSPDNIIIPQANAHGGETGGRRKPLPTMKAQEERME
ncbi:hypothetical protein HOG48_05965 [Candidatus Peregrinibacteria bacterium]|nr:hypothetical protein [Candidatus Peregrinibacteria bacterium]